MQSKTIQPKPIDPQEWPVIEHVIAPLAEWWRRHAAVRKNLDDLAPFAPSEMARMAQDVGITRSPADSGGDCSDTAKLDRRLTALGLSASELAHRAPAELRDMERLCTTCQSKGRCARDLGADPSDPVWSICPNEQALTSLARTRAAAP